MGLAESFLFASHTEICLHTEMLLLIATLLAAQQPSTGPKSAGPCVLRVVVRDAQTSMPLSGIEVQLRASVSGGFAVPAATTPPPAERKGVTDLDGTVVFEDLAPGAYTMQAQADGYRGKTLP